MVGHGEQVYGSPEAVMGTTPFVDAPLFGEPGEDGKREVLEGRFIWLATRALRHGIDVILDFGVWTKNERSALKFLAASTGAWWKLAYLEINVEELKRRHGERISPTPASTFPMSEDDLEEFLRQFEAPDDAERHVLNPNMPDSDHRLA